MIRAMTPNLSVNADAPSAALRAGRGSPVTFTLGRRNPPMPLECPNCVHKLRYWEVAKVCDCPKCKRRLLVSGWRKVALVNLLGFLVLGSLAQVAFYTHGSLILTAVFVALWVWLDFLAHRHLLHLAVAPNASAAPMSSDSK